MNSSAIFQSGMLFWLQFYPNNILSFSVYSDISIDHRKPSGLHFIRKCVYVSNGTVHFVVSCLPNLKLPSPGACLQSVTCPCTVLQRTEENEKIQVGLMTLRVKCSGKQNTEKFLALEGPYVWYQIPWDWSWCCQKVNPWTESLLWGIPSFLHPRPAHFSS